MSQELSCSREAVEKMFVEHPKLLLVFKQTGCPPCEALGKAIEEVSPNLGDIEVAEVELGKGEMDCEAFADQHQVGATPTLVYYKDGKPRKRWVTTGVKDHDVKELLSLSQISSEEPVPPTPEPAGLETTGAPASQATP